MAVVLCLLLAGASVMASPSDSILMQGRLQNLEQQHENMVRELNLHKQELSLQVDERADHNTLVFWVAACMALFGTVSTLVSFWVGIRKAKQTILLQAEGIVEGEVRQRLPGMTEGVMKEAVSAEVAPLNRMLARERENEQFRLETEILCIGETKEDAEAGVERLSRLGYARLKPYVPTEKRLPPSTAYFFNLFRRAPDEGWQHLTDPNLQKWIDDDHHHQSLFFFFVSERKVSHESKRIHPFLAHSNRGFTVDTNLIEAIRDHRLNLQSTTPS